MDTRKQINIREGRDLVLTGVAGSEDFRNKLRQIRDDQARAGVERRRTRHDADLERTDRMILSYDWLERIETVLERYAQDMLAENRTLEISRSFYEGKYLFAVRADETYVDVFGDPVSTYSRLSFLLEPRAEDGTFVIECRSTIRGRDAESVQHAGHMTDGEFGSFEAFIEARYVGFARGYYSALTPSVATL